MTNAKGRDLVRVLAEVVRSPRSALMRAYREGGTSAPLLALLSLEAACVYHVTLKDGLGRLFSTPLMSLLAMLQVLLRHGLVPFIVLSVVALAVALLARVRSSEGVLRILYAVSLTYTPHVALTFIGSLLAALGLDLSFFPHRAGASLVSAWAYLPGVALALPLVSVARAEPCEATMSAKSARLALLELALVAAFVGFYFYRGRTPAPSALPPLRVSALASGDALDPTTLSGRVLVIDFWATWCPPCVATLPALERLSADLEREAFTLVSINVERDDLARVREFLRERRLEMPVYVDTGGAQATMDVQSLPTLFVVDKHGQVRERHIGVTSYETLREQVRTLLAE